MARRTVMALALMIALSALSSPLQASDPTFPVGLWLSDSFGSQHGYKPEWLAALRWQGINLGTAGNANIPLCRNKLARYDSVGYRIWLVEGSFHEFLRVYSRYEQLPINPDTEYFKSFSVGNKQPDPSMYKNRENFNTFLDNVVDSVVDSLKNFHALWKYFYWDEPNGHLFVGCPNECWYADPWERYWAQIWWMAEGTYPTFTRTDYLGTHSWLKWKIEHRDNLHSVLINVSGGPTDETFFNAIATLCTTKYCSPQGDTFPNRMQGITYDVWPFSQSVPVGDISALNWGWTKWADLAESAATLSNPTDPIPVYVTQLQSCGMKTNYPETDARITTPEEVKELANLALLHQDKGIFYFVLPSNHANGRGNWANLWDENFVPFDAPYKEYVYNRTSSFYARPDSLVPFWDATHTVHDPFRTLGPMPDSTSSAKERENFYKWKYAPFGRVWDSLKSINDELHTITPHLRYIWKVGQRITNILPDFHGPPGPPLPEYITFADSTLGHNPTAFYAFIVSKDFGEPQWGYTVTVNANQLPHPPQGQRYYVLDLNSRHLIPTTGNFSFHTVLKTGEGRLFRFIIGPVPPEPGVEAGSKTSRKAKPASQVRGKVGKAVLAASPFQPNYFNGSMWNTLLVTDPDISFHKAGPYPQDVQFTEGDLVVLSAKVYNLGFSSQTDSVKFYLGDPLDGGFVIEWIAATSPCLCEPPVRERNER